MLTQLVLMKLVDAVAAQVAAQAAAEAQAAPRRIAFNAAGKNFIDAYVDAYIAAAPAARWLIIDSILEAAGRTRGGAGLTALDGGQGQGAPRQRDEGAQPGGCGRRRAKPPLGARESGRSAQMHTVYINITHVHIYH